MSNDNDNMSIEDAFDNIIWKQMKVKAKELSKKELAKEFFLAGYSLAQEQFEEFYEDTMKEFKENPEEITKEFEKMKKANGNN
jgi:hypothetical protein